MAAIHFEVDGKPYAFDPITDITLNVLRQVKRQNPELASFTKLTSAFGDGDPDAIALVVWLCRTNAGEKDVPTPAETDLVVANFYEGFSVDEEPDPTKISSIDQEPIGD